MAKETKCADGTCSTCKGQSYGLKHVCAEHLTAYEAVTMSVVGILAIIAGIFIVTPV